MFQFKRNKYRQQLDNVLINSIKVSKDKIAFGVIYERYAHLVMGVCLKYLKDEAESQDMTSKIFEELENKIRKHEITNFKNWLFQVTKNECFMFMRKNKYFYSSSEALANQESEEVEYNDKEAQLIQLENALGKLKQEQAICIKYFYLEDKSYQDIANILQIDIKKIKSFIQNGKRNLQITLLQNEEFETKNT